MAIVVHAVSVLDGGDALANGDRLHVMKVTLAYGAGGSAGASVSGSIPANMMIPGTGVFIGSLAAGLSASVSSGTVTITPLSGSATIAAGSLVILLVA